MAKQPSVIRKEAEQLSDQAYAILLGAQFDGARWISRSVTADAVQELVGARAAVELENGLSITNRGMILRHHLKSIKNRKACVGVRQGHR